MSTVEISVAAEPPVVAPVTTRDVLHRAADLLEEFGWCQGEMYNGDSFCASGALHRAWSDLGLVRGDRPDLDWTAALGMPYEKIPDWNDEPSRTKAEVVARLRQAADAA